MRGFTILTLVTSFLLAGAAWAKPPLRDVDKIDDGILYIAIANEIRNECNSITARMFRALSTIRGLEAHAKSLGYSDQEIETYIDSKAEKARMRRRGEAYLADNGVSYAKPETFCALGRAEIERNSAIGVLLRAR